MAARAVAAYDGPVPESEPVIPGAVSLRPMPFSPADPRRVPDPLFEPLWAGRRVLAHVRGALVELRDPDGRPEDGFQALRQALASAVRAADAVIDGYLVPGRLPDTHGREAPLGMDSVMTPGEVGRQLLVGSYGAGRREEAELSAARRVRLAPDSVTTFVAVDLPWLDGEALVDVPLAERKRLLESVVEDGELVHRTVSVRAPVGTWFAQWRALGFREYAVKGANSRYAPDAAAAAWATAVIPKR
jgi:ATP-dependent DNA ligase